MNLLIKTFFVALICVLIDETCGYVPQLRNHSCGTNKKSGGLIINGKPAEKHQFPWLITLYHHKADKHFCGGNLISKKHILTAASCLQDKNQTKPYSVKDIYVHVARHDLSDDEEIRNDTVNAVSEIILHPDWNPLATNFDADLAILVLQSATKLSMRTQPVCLPLASDPIPYNGYVVS